MSKDSKIVQLLTKLTQKAEFIGIPDTRVTVKDAAKMCGISRTTFNSGIRKQYDLDENEAFGGKITFSRHALLRAIKQHSENHKKRYSA